MLHGDPVRRGSEGSGQQWFGHKYHRNLSLISWICQSIAAFQTVVLEPPQHTCMGCARYMSHMRVLYAGYKPIDI